MIGDRDLPGAEQVVEEIRNAGGFVVLFLAYVHSSIPRRIQDGYMYQMRRDHFRPYRGFV